MLIHSKRPEGISSRSPATADASCTPPRAAVLACRREGDLIAGVITYTAGEVAGISNLFSTGLPAGQLWTSALQAVAALRPHLPIVGYEHGTGLASARQAGCQALGPLRVWIRNPGNGRPDQISGQNVRRPRTRRQLRTGAMARKVSCTKSTWGLGSRSLRRSLAKPA